MENLRTFYRSLDDGELYRPGDLDDPDAAVAAGRFEVVVVPAQIVIDAKHLPGNNDITELLIRSGQRR